MTAPPAPNRADILRLTREGFAPYIFSQLPARSGLGHAHCV
jgi:hypothetical protein